MPKRRTEREDQSRGSRSRASSSAYSGSLIFSIPALNFFPIIHLSRSLNEPSGAWSGFLGAMPPLAAHRTLSSALPTLLSLSKLIHLVPSLGSRSAHRLLIGDTSNVAFLADARIEPEDPPDSPIFWWKLGLSVCLVLSGGVFAGWVIKFVLRNSQLMISRPPYFSVLSIIVKNISLTLALMGSDDMNLRVLSTSSDDPKERKAATKVLKLLQRGRHWVLVVLLLGNVVRLFIHPTAICSMLVKAYR